MTTHLRNSALAFAAFAVVLAGCSTEDTAGDAETDAPVEGVEEAPVEEEPAEDDLLDDGSETDEGVETEEDVEG